MREPVPWSQRDMSGSYEELEHPADLFLVIRGGDLDGLFENALYALYSKVADISDVAGTDSLVIEIGGASREEALRALLAEVLYRFDTTGFIAHGAKVEVTAPPPAAGGPGEVAVVARMRGGVLSHPRDRLLEIKAVTYHRLSVIEDDGRWSATVLFDV